MKGATGNWGLQIQASAQRHGLRGPTAGGEFMLCCPWCEKRAGKVDTKFKLYANPAKGVWICFRCDARGHGDLAWLGMAEAAVETPRTEFMSPPEGFHPIDGGHAMKPFREYLNGRGVLHAAIRSGAGACLTGRYAGRVVIPHVRDHGRVPSGWDGFVARSVMPNAHGPRYLYPAGMNRRGSLWGLAQLNRRNLDELRGIWVVEGVFDALPLWPHAVATFGKNVTGEQIDILVDLSTKGAHNRIVIAFDGDAWMDGKVLAAQLMLRGVDASWAHLPPGEDPGTLGWDVKKFVQG